MTDSKRFLAALRDYIQRHEPAPADLRDHVERWTAFMAWAASALTPMAATGLRHQALASSTGMFTVEKLDIAIATSVRAIIAMSIEAGADEQTAWVVLEIVMGKDIVSTLLEAYQRWAHTRNAGTDLSVINAFVPAVKMAG